MSLDTRRPILPDPETPAYKDETRAYIPIPKSEGSELTSLNPTNPRSSAKKVTYSEYLYSRSRCRQSVGRLIDSYPCMISMTILTIYTLFADDIRNLATMKKHDDIWFAFATLCLACFLLELVLSCITKRGYLWSFYFWLDLVATISLIPDIGWIWYPIVGVDDSSSGGDATKIHNVGKAARAGTRTSRVIRIVRLIRLIRLVKLYKSAQQVIKAKQAEESVNSDDSKPFEESNIGKILTSLTIKRVIVLVLILLLILPLFDTDFYLEPFRSWDFGLEQMKNFYNKSGFDVVRQEFIVYHEDSTYPIIYLAYDDKNSNEFKWESNTHHGDLRFNEKHYAETDYNLVAVFDLRAETQLSALLNILRTIFVCVVLTLGAVYFTKDSTDLVITPIEKMMNKVQKISKNPMKASEVRFNDIYEMVNSSKKPRYGLCFCHKTELITTEYETAVLEDTIIKIGVLLALGFGEAGSSIIATSMQEVGDFILNMQGNRCMAIFGFCDIRNFTDATEVLREGVMVFVNEIAQIVHGIVDKYQGAANKNIGDAFLLVWKLDDSDIDYEDSEGLLKEDSFKVRYLADCALFSFVKIIAKINRCPSILKYRQHDKLNERLPGYQVKMGFGLHMGWAIEGAIGSEYKIDASYLSPNVNLASRLEAATKQFGVPILMSGNLFDCLSEPVKSYCRHIDAVTVKGSEKPISLYTIDLDYSNLPPKSSRRLSTEGRGKLRKFKAQVSKGNIKSHLLFEKSKVFQLMRQGLSLEFLYNFEKAVSAYINGNWREAKEYVHLALIYVPNDGPSETLLSVLASEDFQAPPGWSGYRVLTEK
jgi:class 3 adenylate cyclase